MNNLLVLFVPGNYCILKWIRSRKVLCTMKTSSPRTVSSKLGWNSPSLKRLTDTSPSRSPLAAAIFSAFKLRKASLRGSSVLKLQYSKDLGVTDAWQNHTITVPDTSGSVGGVVFMITPVSGQDYNQVQATIPASAAGGGGKVFVRLIGEIPIP